MFTTILYVLAGAGLLVSFLKDRQKTKASLKKAWKAFENILPQFLGIIVIIGLSLTFLEPETISSLLGRESGPLGMLAAVIVGSATLIPGFVAFPLAAALLDSGAGIPQIATFVSSLMMVGVVTLPAEFKVMGRKAAFLRNGFALLYSIAVGVVMGGVL